MTFFSAQKMNNMIFISCSLKFLLKKRPVFSLFHFFERGHFDIFSDSPLFCARLWYMKQMAVQLFRSLLVDGMKRVNVQVSPCVQTYVENLLVFYIHSDRLFEMDIESGRRRLKTLSEFYFKAQKASLRDQLNILKKIGDQSLYLSGFFRESLKRKPINFNYYINMGQNAYESLAQHYPREGVFSELSFSFQDLTDVLSYISLKKNDPTDKDLLQILSDYMETGSKASACRLEDHGVLPPPPSFDRSH